MFFFLHALSVEASCTSQDVGRLQTLVATHSGIPFQHEVVLSTAIKVTELGIACFKSRNPYENSKVKADFLILIWQFYFLLSPRHLVEANHWHSLWARFHQWSQEPNDYFANLESEIYSYLQFCHRYWKEIAFQEKWQQANKYFNKFREELRSKNLAGRNVQEQDQIYEQSLSRQTVLHITTQTLKDDFHFNTLLMAVDPELRHPQRIEYLTKILSMVPDQVHPSVQQQIDSYKYLAAVDLLLEYRWQYHLEPSDAKWNKQLAMQHQVDFWASRVEISDEDHSPMAESLRDKRARLAQDLTNLVLTPFVEHSGADSVTKASDLLSSENKSETEQLPSRKIEVFSDEHPGVETPLSSPSISQPGAPRPGSDLDKGKSDSEGVGASVGEDATTSHTVSRVFGRADPSSPHIPTVPEFSDEGTLENKQESFDEKKDPQVVSQFNSSKVISLPLTELENSGSASSGSTIGETLEAPKMSSTVDGSEKKIPEALHQSPQLPDFAQPRHKGPSKRNQRKRKGKPPISLNHLTEESSDLPLSRLARTEGAKEEKQSRVRDMKGSQKESVDLSSSISSPEKNQALDEKKSSEAKVRLSQVGLDSILELRSPQELTDRQGSTDEPKQSQTFTTDLQASDDQSSKALQRSQEQEKKPKKKLQQQKKKKKNSKKLEINSSKKSLNESIDWDEFKEEPTKFTSGEKMREILGALSNPMIRLGGIKQAEEWIQFLDSKSLILKIDRENKLKALFHLAKALPDRVKQLEVWEKASQMVENEDFGDWGIECQLEYYRILTLESSRYGKKSQTEARFQRLITNLEKSTADEATKARWSYDLAGILSRNRDYQRFQEVYVLAKSFEDKGPPLMVQSSLSFSERINELSDPQFAFHLTLFQRYRIIAQFLLENVPEKISEPEVRTQLQVLALKLLEGSKERDFPRFHQLYFEFIGRTILLRLTFSTEHWRAAYQASNEFKQFIARDLNNRLTPLDNRLFESSLNLFWQTMIQGKLKLGDEQGAKELHAEVLAKRFKSLSPFVNSVSSEGEEASSSLLLDLANAPLSELEIDRLFDDLLESNDLRIFEYQAKIDQLLDRVIYEPGKLHWLLLRGHLMKRLYDHVIKVGNLKSEVDYEDRLTHILKSLRLVGEKIFDMREKSQDQRVMEVSLYLMQTADSSLQKRNVITEDEYNRRTSWILQECKRRKIPTTTIDLK